MICVGAILFSIFLPSLTIKGDVTNTDGLKIANTKLVVEYKTGNLSDKEFYAYETVSTDNNGEFLLKLEKCNLDKPIKIVAFAKDYIPEFYILPSSKCRKIKTHIILNKTSTRNFTYSFKDNTVFLNYDSISNEVNTQFLAIGCENVTFSKRNFENNVISFQTKNTLDSVILLIKAVPNYKINLIDNSNISWLYGRIKTPDLDELTSISKIHQKNSFKSIPFVLKSNESLQYRCIVNFDYSETMKSFSLSFSYVLEKLNETEYYYCPQKLEDIRHFFELMREEKPKFIPLHIR